MAKDSMETQCRWLETIMDNFGRNNQVSKVISVQEENVVDKGDSYSSDMIRLKMDVLLGSGKKTKKSVIVKNIPTEGIQAKLMNKIGAFNKEIKLYTEVLPNMTDLLNELEDGSEPMWSTCYNFTRFNQIVLEDLKVLGYQMIDKRKGMNLDEASLAVKSLGKFHALSVVLVERGLLDLKDYSSDFFTIIGDNLNSFRDNGLECLATVIESSWGPEWKHYATKLRNLIGKHSDIMNKIYKAEGSKFIVLNHADSWCNNMMFKYDEGNKPIGLRFIDFQISYKNSCGYDLQYFLSSSLSEKIRKNHEKELLEQYHESVTTLLRKFKISEEKIPTLDDVKEEVKRTSFLSIILVSSLLTFMLSEPEDAQNIGIILKSKEENARERSLKPYQNKIYTERAKFILKSCHEQGVI